MISTIIMATAEPKMYMSVFDAGGAVVGDAVNAAPATKTDLNAFDPQNEVIQPKYWPAEPT